MSLLPANDERELLQQLKESNEHALALLYKAHWQSLFLSAYNILKDKKACEDIVQEIFLQLWLKRESLEVRESLKIYLTTAVRYQVFHYIRKTSKRKSIKESVGRASVVESSDEPLLRKDLHGRVAEAVEELPEKCKQVYRLSREEQLTHKEIAQCMNISVKTVENQLTIALRRLRHYLKEYSIISVCLLVLSFFL